MEDDMGTNDTKSGFGEGLEKLAGILDETARKLKAFAETPEPDDGEPAEPGAGKTDGEIETEDEIAEMIAAPIVGVLEGISEIIDRATDMVEAMTFGDSQTPKTPGKDADGVF